MIAHTVVDEKYSIFGPLFVLSARACGYTPQIFATGVSPGAKYGFDMVGYKPVIKKYPLSGAGLAAMRYLDLDGMKSTWAIFDSDCIIIVPEAETTAAVTSRMDGKPYYALHGVWSGSGRRWAGDFERVTCTLIHVTPEWAARTERRRVQAIEMMQTDEWKYREADEVMLNRIIRSSRMSVFSESKHIGWAKPYVHLGDFRPGRRERRVKKMARRVDVHSLWRVITTPEAQQLIGALKRDPLFSGAYDGMVKRLSGGK